MNRMDQLMELIERYKQLGIDSQIDYEKFYLYSIITHSTAIEGSTVTEIENQLLFDEGISAKGKTIVEQMMNLDLKRAYEESIRLAKQHSDITIDVLKELSHLVMQNTGSTYKTALGDFSSANGDLRLVNVTAGVGGRSYLSYQKVPTKLQEFCDWLNEQRRRPMSMPERYILSFEAHYRLVTIHPWADGNGRMARLIMNHIQFEFGLVPAKVLKEDKGDYINALIITRDTDDISHFLEFMTEEMIKTLSSDIDTFLKSMNEGGEII
ncbi:MAG: Fic family protein, partial [Prevotella sp.]|nr:Fic family protein [Prevotella sp.]